MSGNNNGIDKMNQFVYNTVNAFFSNKEYFNIFKDVCVPKERDRSDPTGSRFISQTPTNLTSYYTACHYFRNNPQKADFLYKDSGGIKSGVFGNRRERKIINRCINIYVYLCYLTKILDGIRNDNLLERLKEIYLIISGFHEAMKSIIKKIKSVQNNIFSQLGEGERNFTGDNLHEQLAGLPADLKNNISHIIPAGTIYYYYHTLAEKSDPIPDPKLTPALYIHNLDPDRNPKENIYINKYPSVVGRDNLSKPTLDLILAEIDRTGQYNSREKSKLKIFYQLYDKVFERGFNQEYIYNKDQSLIQFKDFFDYVEIFNNTYIKDFLELDDKIFDTLHKLGDQITDGELEKVRKIFREQLRIITNLLFLMRTRIDYFEDTRPFVLPSRNPIDQTSMNRTALLSYLTQGNIQGDFGWIGSTAEGHAPAFGGDKVNISKLLYQGYKSLDSILDEMNKKSIYDEFVF
jgi:hypothetical protein